MPLYAIKATRTITRDGVPFVTIRRVNMTVVNVDEADADRFIREAVAAMNERAELIYALTGLLQHADKIACHPDAINLIARDIAAARSALAKATKEPR